MMGRAGNASTFTWCVKYIKWTVVQDMLQHLSLQTHLCLEIPRNNSQAYGPVHV